MSYNTAPSHYVVHRTTWVRIASALLLLLLSFLPSHCSTLLYGCLLLSLLLAPEIVLTQGHDGAADLWAYGVVLYELMCGTTPFSGRNQQRTFEKIVHSQKHLQFQQVFDSHGKSLIRRLLHPNASLRIGCLQNGFKDIKDHAFFLTQNIDFQKLLLKDILISFIPSTSRDHEEDPSTIPTPGAGNDWIDINSEMRLPWNDEIEAYFDGLCNSCMIDDDD